MEAGGTAPMLLFIVGAPAAGKMTVGREIAARTGLRLFHNHVSIEPALRYFDFGHPSFVRLVEGFRTAVFEEVAKSDLPGLIFTYVWAFDLPSELETVEAYTAPFRERGGRVVFAELRCPLEERLRRNEGAARLAEKPSKRDVAASRQRLLEHEEQYRLISPDDYAARPDWLVIDNTAVPPDVVAERVIAHHALPALV